MFRKRIATIILAFGLAAGAAGQGPWITEIKAVNSGIFPDEDGEASDWIELYNRGPATVNLNGWFLTDERGDLLKWSFPATNLAAGGFLVVFASGKDRRVAGRQLHTSFGLKAGGEYLALVEPDGLTIVQEFAPVYPEQAANFSYGFPMVGTEVLTAAPRFFAETPGRPNPPPGAELSLALTELMYNPAPPTVNGAPAGFGYPYSYVELKNTGTNAIDLAGIYFGAGIRFTFPSDLLAPGARVLVVYNIAAFESRYGPGLPIAGQFTGGLDGSGERLALYGPDGATIFSFIYDQAWHRITDGHGFSLVPVNEDAPSSTYDRPSSWRVSGRRYGSPGRADVPSVIPPILINEALTRTKPPFEDALELFNPGTNDVDVGGWFLTDDFDRPGRFTLPRGTVIPPGGFLALDEHTFNPHNDDPLATGFGLGDLGEELYIFSATNGDLTGFVHGFKFGTAEVNTTFGRHVLSTGEEQFVPQAAMTFFATNAGPKVGPVVISEVHYHPLEFAATDNKRDEFIELHNITEAPVALYDMTAPSNTWRLLETRLNSLSFQFPQGTVLPSNGFALITRFATNDPSLPAFIEANQVPPGTLLFGPWFGSLANSEGNLELSRPDPPEQGIVPFIVVDKVDYRDSLPWPLGADGTGASMQRIEDRAFGNDPANWRAAFPNPGATSSVPPIVISQPTDQTVQAGVTVFLEFQALGDGPLAYQWRFNGVEIAGATTASLGLTNIQPAQTGGYACRVSNPAGVLLSRIATVQVVDSQPPSLAVTSPATPLSRLGHAALTCSGWAADNGLVASVRIQNGSTPFVSATGTTNWSAAISLKPGFNTLRFVALDSFGNASPTNTIFVLLQPTAARLGLLIQGSGSISGPGNGRLLQLGRSYTLKAIPAPGHFFSNWMTLDPGVVSTNPVLTFVMSSNLTLAASFRPGPFVGLQGDYNGLFYNPTNPAHTNAGYFTLRMTPGGGYSGRLVSLGRAYALHGRFDDDFTARQLLHRAGSNDLTVTLHVASRALTGEVSELRFQSELAGHHTGFTGSSATNFAGRYVGAFTNAAASASGAATVSVNAGGRLALRGRLPDRTVVAKDLMAGADGLAPLYVPLYRNAGSAFGWVALTNAPPETLKGPLLWTRTGAHGFTNTIELRGRR